MIELVEVKPHDLTVLTFLYDLMSERTPDVNISHRAMPTFDQHRAFVASQPYREWFLIMVGDDFCNGSRTVGAIYLSKQNEIGIFIKKFDQSLGLGKMAVNKLMEMHPKEQLLANINPRNARSIRMFEEMGFELLQITYSKRPTC